MLKRTKIKVLYVTYLGILEPLSKSQVLPYILALSGDSKIHLLSFEKKWLLKKETEEFKKIKNNLQEKGIIWHRLAYHKYPYVLSSIFDIFVGIILSLFIIIRHRINILHARANIPIAIGYVLKSLLPINLLYDRRGIMGEEHLEHSGWKKGGYLYRFALWFEKKVINKCDAIVVLSHKANTQIRQNINPRKNILIKTIPCCVDLGLFRCMDGQNLKNELGLSEKFILIYSGSVGTYNLLDEMFDFFLEMLKLIPDAHFLVLTQNKDTALGLLEKREDLDKNKITITTVTQEKLPILLSAADAGLVFRRPSPAAVCASPTKFAEYLACGLPVVSVRGVGDLEEIINANKIGIILKEYNSNEYSLAVTGLRGLLRDKDALRKSCRMVAEEYFSLIGGSHSYLSIYNYLLNN